MMQQPQKIILDCDPGHDDAVALMIAAKHPAIELLGVTVVAGNQTLEKTVTNALNVVQALDLDIPVYAGCGQPMVRERQVIAGDIHGSTGLDGPVFDELKIKAEDQHAVLYLIDTLRKSDGDITLVPTGPLTNIAMAMRLAPDIEPKIKQIVLMGGSYQHGNVTPAAEFNIFADAEAAHVVFHCGRPIVMMGLDVTRQALCFPKIVDHMATIGNKASKLFVDILGFFNKTQKEVYGWDGGPLHDPTCIAWLIDPTCIDLKAMYTDVDIRSEQSYGRTNCDFFGYIGKEPNAQVAIKLHVDRFWDIIEEGLRAYDE